jgi:hypothetical protein
MNTRQWLLGLMLLITSASSALGQERKSATFSLEPEMEYSFGYTRYELSINVPPVGDISGVRSRLNFPLDGLTAGLKVRLNGHIDPKHSWSAAVGLATHVTDPSSKMTDGDWYRLSSGADLKFSYTESKAPLTSLLLTGEFSYGIISGRRTAFDLILGYRYQRIVEDITGYKGWFFDGADKVPVSGTEHALYYRVTYHAPSVGMRLVIGQPMRTTVHLEGSFAPAYMSDFDDHLLRMKSSTASGWGLGGAGSGGVKLILTKGRRGLKYLDLSARLMYASGSMKQTQRFYGDDPGTSDNETGLVFSGIPYSIKTMQYGINARFGIEF